MSSGFISAEQAEKKRRERQEEWDRKECTFYQMIFLVCWVESCFSIAPY